MALLPARNILDGTALPVTSQMKTALGTLRDYCSDLLGTDSSNKAAARTALGAVSSEIAGMRNLLINGNLAINQRGYVSGAAVGAANTYTLDRWRVVTSGQNLAFTASGNGSSMTAPAGGVEQVIEGANIGGGTYVLGWTGTATATVNGTACANGATFTLPANTNATVRLIGGTASLVQLEPGGTVTPFEHRPYGVELALCQRYHYSYESGGGGQNEFGTGFCRSALSFLFSVKYPVKMRSTPTFTFSGAVGDFAVGLAAGAVAPTSITAQALGPESSMIDFTVSTGLTAGQGGRAYASGGVRYIQFSAEL